MTEPVTEVRPVRTAPRRSLGWLLLEFLGSMNLAITLLVVVSIASVIGTVLKQNEPFQNYIIKFGPFWFEVFQRLGLSDVYSAAWFVGILAFLVVSTSVCLYRHVPGMLREMSHYRTDVQAKSLRAFHNRAEWRVAADRAAVLAGLGEALKASGFKARLKDHGDHVVAAGMRGGFNRLGYLFTHLAIVVICLGGLFDGNLLLKWREWRGDIRLETRDVAARDVPPESRLAPGTTPSFRGNIMLPEGSASNFAFLRLRDGFFVQELPFALELKKFRVDYYPTGQPKDFVSQVLVHDSGHLDKPLEATIRVNHPLVYRGYAIYQSDFGDGGSKLRLRAWPLAGQKAEAPVIEGSVGQKLGLKTPQGELTLELEDFRLFNILPLPKSEVGEDETDQAKKFRNFGPNFTFKLRDSAGQALEYVSYMVPTQLDGRGYFLAGTRSTPAEEYSYLRIPADPKGTPTRFLKLVAALHDAPRVEAILDANAAQGTQPVPAEVREVRKRLVGLFAKGGADAVIARAKEVVPAERLQEATGLYLEILRGSLAELYLQVLRDEGLVVESQLGEAEQRFFEDALNALAVLPNYGSPFYLQLENFEQVQASGLQIAKAGGQNIVYLGFALLIVGVFVMFYTSHRRVWAWIADDAGGGTRVILAGTGNRHQQQFDREFAALRARLAQRLGIPSEHE